VRLLFALILCSLVQPQLRANIKMAFETQRDCTHCHPAGQKKRWGDKPSLITTKGLIYLRLLVNKKKYVPLHTRHELNDLEREIIANKKLKLYKRRKASFEFQRNLKYPASVFPKKLTTAHASRVDDQTQLNLIRHLKEATSDFEKLQLEKVNFHSRPGSQVATFAVRFHGKSNHLKTIYLYLKSLQNKGVVSMASHLKYKYHPEESVLVRIPGVGVEEEVSHAFYDFHQEAVVSRVELDLWLRDLVRKGKDPNEIPTLDDKYLPSDLGR